MKQKNIAIIAIATIFISVSINAAGRGGGGGGGAHYNTARSPSKSGVGGGHYQQMSGQSRNQFQNAIQHHQTQQTPGSAQQQTHFQNSYQSMMRNNTAASNRLSNDLSHDYPGYHNWFNNDFYNRHNFYPNGYDYGVNAWDHPGWNEVSGWFPWGWSDPYYYNDSGYYYLLSQQNATTASSYPQQQVNNQPSDGSSQQMIPGSNIQTNQTAQSDWLPLGVYAVGSNNSAASGSNMFIQLAANKQGEISGTYYNASTDETHQIDGIIDRQTQKAVWKLTDSADAPMMVAGMYNLTQDVVPVQVQFNDGSDQSWVLVRVNQSQS